MQGLVVAHAKASRKSDRVPYERNEPLRMVCFKTGTVNVNSQSRAALLGQRCLSIVQTLLARGRVAHRMPGGNGWRRPRRRQARASSEATTHASEAEPTLGDLGDTPPSLELAALELAAPHSDEPQLLVIARELWRADYAPLFEEEYLVNKAVLGAGYALPPSSYAQRLQGQRLEEYERRMRARERDAMAIALHANNMRVWTPSLLARSVSYFTSASSFTQATEGRARRLASRPTTLRFLRLMRDVRPPVRFECGMHVSMYVADQTYQWVGMKKRGRRQSLERHDAQGMPMAISHEVYVNSVKLHLPASIANLSPAALAAIAANHGSPYTEDYYKVLDPLEPSVVDASLSEFASDAIASVAQCVPAGFEPDALSIRQIATALFGRPPVDPGGA